MDKKWIAVVGSPRRGEIIFTGGYALIVCVECL